MRVIKFFKIIFPILVVLIGYYGHQLYTDEQGSITETQALYSMSSQKLSSLFLVDEEKSNAIYIDKVIEVRGIVDTITFLNNRNTVILQGENPKTYVICEIHPTEIMQIQQIKRGTKIQLKGICKGRLNDVVLLNCLFTNKPIHE